MRHSMWLLVMTLSAITWCGCKTADPAAAKAQGEARDAVAPTPTPTQRVPSAGPGAPLFLQGVYVISEVQEKGKISMVPPGSDISFTFLEDSTFARSTHRKGQVHHTDAGNYSIDGNKLTLTATISEKQILQTSTEKTYSFELSADGEELKLTAPDGKTAVFRRQAKSTKGSGKS